MAREKRSVMAPHTLCSMVVVIGDWAGTDAIVVGAVEDSLYDAYVEEERWEEVKARMWAESGLEDTVDKTTLKEVKVEVWMPFLWEPLPAEPEAKEGLVDPDQRFRAAVAALKRREDEAHAAGEEGTPNDIAIAHGEANGLQMARELLQGELPDESE